MRWWVQHRQLLTIAILTTIVVIIIILAIPTRALTLATTQCTSLFYNMFTTGLEPGWYTYYNLIVPVPSVTLTIQALLISNASVEVAVFTPSNQEIWSTQPSTVIVGTYTVTLSGPGTYRIAVYNPTSNMGSAYVLGLLNVTMCGFGAAETWLSQFTQLWSTNVVSNGVNLTMAPMGIVAYGVMEVNGQYYAYTLTTDAVKGVVYIPQGVSASDYYQNGTYYGDAFSIQLNAYVVAKLADGSTQYYWIDNVVSLQNGQLWVWDNIWNDTTFISYLNSADVQGNGSVYYYFSNSYYDYYYGYAMPNPVPFGRVTLEVGAYASGGSVIINFYADGQHYDSVKITPSTPVVSAYIEVAPVETPAGTPMDLELVLTGYAGDEPYTVLNSGQVGMSLYVDVNGVWVPPPSAWTVGYSTYEESYSYVAPNGAGSAIVEPGSPNNEELWGGTVVVTPMGTYVATGTDLSQYLPQLVNLGNGTRLVLTNVLINGQPANVQELNYVPLGSLVVGEYTRQYLVSISAPTNETTGWFNAGSVIVLNEPPLIYFNNGTRLINPTLNGEPLPTTIIVTGPMNLTVTYTRQYYVVLNSPGNATRGWFNAGSIIYIQPIVNLGNGTRLINPSPPYVVVNGPLNVTVSYVKQYYVVVNSPVNSTAFWVNAGSIVLVNEPSIVNFGNGTRLINPTLNGEPLPLTLIVVKPMSLTITYTRQYYVTIKAPGNVTSNWFNEGSTLYIQPIVNLGNGTRLANPSPAYVVVNGSMTVNVTYTRQYLVSISAPTNVTSAWVNAGSVILIDEPQVINLNNGTRLVNPTLNGQPIPQLTIVNSPLELSISYVRQYYVIQSSIFGTSQGWFNASSQFMPNAVVHVVSGVVFKPSNLIVNGVEEPITALTVSGPMNVTVVYQAAVNVSTMAWGLPALYASATLACGSKSVTATGYLTGKLMLSMINPPTYECTITTTTTPLTPILVIVAAIVAAVTLFARRRNKYSLGQGI